VDCTVSSWSNWGSCSATCGSGSQSRSRTVTRPAANGGYPCPTLTDQQTCNTAACAGPVDCTVSNWSNWGACSVTCGSGSQSRSRSVTRPAANGGYPCPTLTDQQSCTAPACSDDADDTDSHDYASASVDCSVSEWSAWGACSASCGSGTQTRRRTITTPPAHGGYPCPSSLTQQQSCNTAACPKGKSGK
jgi:hypothetical protein